MRSEDFVELAFSLQINSERLGAAWENTGHTISKVEHFQLGAITMSHLVLNPFPVHDPVQKDPAMLFIITQAP